MRSISQTFADHLQKREYKVAGLMLKKHGLAKTRALHWLAMHIWKGDGEKELLDQLDELEIPANEIVDAYLLRLAMKPSMNGEDPILEWLDKRVDFTLLDDRSVIYHAVYHDRYEILGYLAKKLAQVGREVDWNQDRKGLGTPIYIALRENHEETVAELIRFGADPDRPLQPGVLGAGMTALQAASFCSGNKDTRDTYMKAKRRVALEQIAQKAGKIVRSGAKKVGLKM